MSPELPEPGPSTDVSALLVTYLAFYREAVADRVADLTDAQLRARLLPSGWSPIELVQHLIFMERRWLVWGFLGEQVDEPWGDRREGRWHVAEGESLDELLGALRRGGARTREIVAAAELTDRAALGGRFTSEQGRPSLTAILLHVFQEYARHAGHLDVVRELLDGRTGE